MVDYLQLLEGSNRLIGLIAVSACLLYVIVALTKKLTREIRSDRKKLTRCNTTITVTDVSNLEKGDTIFFSSRPGRYEVLHVEGNVPTVKKITD